MALRDWFSRQSPLQRALKRGMADGGDISAEIHGLDDYSLKSKEDAEAVCEILSELTKKQLTEIDTSALHSLIGLFQDVEGRDCPAYDVMADNGIPSLIRMIDQLLAAPESEEDNPDHEDLILFALKIMAMYGTAEGTDTVLKAAQKPLNPDTYMWSVILGQYTQGHPQAERLFDSLGQSLPTGFLAMALLDAVNSAKIDGANFPHPFDSPTGYKQLENWLTDPDESHFSYAVSTAAGLPFISSPTRDALLAIAFDHPSPDVQIEAAWASAKLGGEAGIKWLARCCCDVNLSDKAKRYLTELGREDAIPAEANDRDFAAKADFAQWLAHPSELGRPPDEVEIIDHRVLTWPPDWNPKSFWLIRYVLRDQTGLKDDDVDCGFVGAMTWCHFCYQMNQRPPEDAYAIHCYWAMNAANLIEEREVTDASEYVGMLANWHGDKLESPVICWIAELSPKLVVPAKLVALATAKRNGQEGWVVLDGSQSAWYAKEDQPDESTDHSVLMLHVGRQLLGFHVEPDRKKYLTHQTPKRDPQQFVAAYERYLSEIPCSPPQRQVELMGSGTILSRKFTEYVEAAALLQQRSKSDILIEVYERALKLAAEADQSIHEKIYCSSSLLGQQFSQYVEELAARNQKANVLALLELFNPLWNHNLGFGLLGSAAFKIGRRDIAEPYFLKLREGLKDYCRAEEMGMLAEIWHDRDEVTQARELMIDCMRKLIVMISESEFNDSRRMYAEAFAHHRTTYLRLFPEGNRELADQGIPENPL